MDDFSKPRINASMLSSYRGRTVCVLGMAKDLPSGQQKCMVTIKTVPFDYVLVLLCLHHMNLLKPEVKSGASEGDRVDNNGTAFTLTTSDGKDVRVLMQEPLGEYLAGLTEVHGQVTGSNDINCESYVAFPQETSDSFDLNLYNEAVELTARLSKHYIVGVQE